MVKAAQHRNNQLAISYNIQ